MDSSKVWKNVIFAVFFTSTYTRLAVQHASILHQNGKMNEKASDAQASTHALDMWCLRVA